MDLATEIAKERKEVQVLSQLLSQNPPCVYREAWDALLKQHERNIDNFERIQRAQAELGPAYGYGVVNGSPS